MNRYKILHRTYYNFSGLVHLGPHVLRLRPREGADLHIESSSLILTPAAKIRWHRDVENNAIATATFNTPTSQLVIESEVIIQQFNRAPLDFVMADYAVRYPFSYDLEDRILLAPYLKVPEAPLDNGLRAWITESWRPGDAVDTFPLLERLNTRIAKSLTYRSREEPGVQRPVETLEYGCGSCRDFANLLMTAAQHLGFAARFVSGYLHTIPSTIDYGATHAWTEIYLPGAGWRGFDPTHGEMAGSKHIAVAVGRLPQSVPPVSGSFVGPEGTSLDVGVWVTEL